MNTDAYLQRINYNGLTNVNAKTLRALQLAHLQSVPFENLSIHAGQPIVLNDESLFEKIVDRRRGGFCYELNGLFAALLRSLGFNVTMLSARVFNSEAELGPDFDHMTLLVNLDQRWLVDVGFGDSFREPLLLDERDQQLQGERAYRIDSAGDDLKLFQRTLGGDWQAQYQFTLQGYNYPDFAEMCHFHQTSPQSHFTRKRVCTIATPQGRLTLSDMRFITTLAGGERNERVITNDKEYSSLLKEHFGIPAI
jgi:N-hydroxyarylamine O-acetyltransferase